MIGERLLHRRPSVTIKSHRRLSAVCRAHEHEARLGLRAAVQGRGARSRAPALPALFVGLPPVPPGPPACYPLPRRHHRMFQLGHLRRPLPSTSTGSVGHGLYDDIWQAFAVACSGRDSGRQWATARTTTTSWLCAATSTDGMTADFYEVDREVSGRDRHAHHQRGEEAREPGGMTTASKRPGRLRGGSAKAAVAQFGVGFVRRCSPVFRVQRVSSGSIGFDFNSIEFGIPLCLC